MATLADIPITTDETTIRNASYYIPDVGWTPIIDVNRWNYTVDYGSLTPNEDKPSFVSAQQESLSVISDGTLVTANPITFNTTGMSCVYREVFYANSNGFRFIWGYINGSTLDYTFGTAPTTGEYCQLYAFGIGQYAFAA